MPLQHLGYRYTKKIIYLKSKYNWGKHSLHFIWQLDFQFTSCLLLNILRYKSSGKLLAPG